MYELKASWMFSTVARCGEQREVDSSPLGLLSPLSSASKAALAHIMTGSVLSLQGAGCAVILYRTRRGSTG